MVALSAEPGSIGKILLYRDSPSKPPQFLVISQLPFPILGKFFAPELQFGLRLPATPWVLVPETAVHKDRCPETRQYNIRYTAKVSSM